MGTLVIENSSTYKKVICVYKIEFGSGFFYIGSTKNLQQRIFVWNSFFKGVKVSKQSKYFLRYIETEVSVSLTILAKCKSTKLARKAEDRFLAENKNNPLLINRSKTAFGNKGIIWHDFEKEAISKKMLGIKRSELTKSRRGQLLQKFDLNGNLLGEYSSYEKAAENSNCSRIAVAKVANGVKRSHNGFIFKYANE
jgi:predicted GIY-YIG superfamily endonuclease